MECLCAMLLTYLCVLSVEHFIAQIILVGKLGYELQSQSYACLYSKATSQV